MATVRPAVDEAAKKPLDDQVLTSLTEINLNGGIIANKGFVKQFATPGTTVIQGKYVSAWGGIQSAGQFFGQVVRNTYLLDMFESQLTVLTPAAPICHRGMGP